MSEPGAPETSIDLSAIEREAIAAMTLSGSLLADLRTEGDTGRAIEVRLIHEALERIAAMVSDTTKPIDVSA